MNAPLTVYTLPNCVQCTMTKQALDTAGVTYVLVDLANDERAVNLVKELGHTSAPVVITETASWSGFRPDKIAAVAAARILDPADKQVSESGQ
ncbi:glutaredoxin-like protein NrdH [Cryobacterium melibiosiphilum]|uniref:Glutaredoxin-like protein NrdH n=1 Tax=Cryobacterium melibiosiphilum TaxID=995039 RepID=A0A3A5MPE8_9MICO|nr:glutaredoxin-like protein NrdH [Cryobacterium melibiosiphilum]RJT90961.1 glutaredoxin-like protein NrdH [Cryobacterium melibiosiphilum]